VCAVSTRFSVWWGARARYHRKRVTRGRERKSELDLEHRRGRERMREERGKGETWHEREREIETVMLRQRAMLKVRDVSTFHLPREQIHHDGRVPGDTSSS
jgi:hypothetical protein